MRRFGRPGLSPTLLLALLLAASGATDSFAATRGRSVEGRKVAAVDGGEVIVSFRFELEFSDYEVRFTGYAAAENRTATARTLCVQGLFSVGATRAADPIETPFDWFPKGGQPGYFSSPPYARLGPVGAWQESWGSVSIITNRPVCRLVPAGGETRFSWSQAQPILARISLQPQSARAVWARVRVCAKTETSAIVGCTAYDRSLAAS